MLKDAAAGLSHADEAVGPPAAAAPPPPAGLFLFLYR